MPFVYGVKSKYHNDKIVYVGKCISLINTRKLIQINDAILYGRKSRFCSAIRKYGSENFEYHLLEEIFDLEMLNDKEKYYIRFYDTIKTGYNMSEGGDGGLTKKVAKYDLAGNLLDTYSSLTLASLKENIPIPHISGMINGTSRKRKHVKYMFTSYDEVPISNINPYIHRRSLSVKSIDSDGNQMLFSSLKEAGKYFGINPSSIRKSINTNIPHKKIKWNYT